MIGGCPECESLDIDLMPMDSIYLFICKSCGHAWDPINPPEPEELRLFRRNFLLVFGIGLVE